jgi:hypothetical protein
LKKHTEPQKRLIVTTSATGGWVVLIDCLIRDFKRTRYHHYQEDVNLQKTPNTHSWEIEDNAHVIESLEKKLRKSLKDMGLAEEKFTIEQKEP